MFVNPEGDVHDLLRMPGWPSPGFLGAFSASGAPLPPLHAHCEARRRLCCAPQTI